MNPIEFWRLSPSFSIIQATLLFCGRDPSEIEHKVENDRRFQPPGYIAIRTSLVNAVRERRIEAYVKYEESGFGQSSDIDISGTTIDRDQLDRFFDASPIPGHFFGRWGSVGGNTQASAQLPPKLNAVLRAWTAVTSDPALTRGKSPKQALRSWLIQHAGELGLMNRQNEINETGIEEICKVANWKPEGGATPTPGPLPAPLQPRPLPKPDFWDEIDDEIPF